VPVPGWILEEAGVEIQPLFPPLLHTSIYLLHYYSYFPFLCPLCPITILLFLGLSYAIAYYIYPTRENRQPAPSFPPPKKDTHTHTHSLRESGGS
jgi:hypothetical protein